MSVVLVRIDDRLIHGQVVEGWLKIIHATHIAVASDSMAADDTQKALYQLAVPYGIGFSCFSLRQAVKLWTDSRWEKERILVLTASPEEVLQLVNGGALIQSVNIGGLHYREGRTQILKAVSLDERDVRALKVLAARGILLEARPLPLDEPVALASYLERWEQERQALRDEPR